jgi:hypothetical protein
LFFFVSFFFVFLFFCRHDEVSGVIWVGGASVDDGGGALMGFKIGESPVSTTALFPTSAPVVGGAIVQKLRKLYLGMSSGEIAVFNLESNKFEAPIPSQPHRFDIAFLVPDEEETGMWMAFRREENTVANWCYQEYFKLPDLKSEIET